jgi:hypothetical protein
MVAYCPRLGANTRPAGPSFVLSIAVAARAVVLRFLPPAYTACPPLSEVALFAWLGVHYIYFGNTKVVDFLRPLYCRFCYCLIGGKFVGIADAGAEGVKRFAIGFQNRKFSVNIFAKSAKPA